MKASDLIELRSRSPFVPFEIRVNDGSSVHIEEPFQIATPRNSPECAIYESEDRVRFVAYRDIVEVVTAPVNGSQQETP
jgi:hypothetical protein